MSTDQKVCYKLVEAVKSGHLPPNMQEMQCGPLSHARWLTTGESILFLWTRKHDLTGSNLKVLEMLVKFCLQWYFKLYFDMKVKHYIVDAPYHILISLKVISGTFLHTISFRKDHLSLLSYIWGINDESKTSN